MGLCIFVSLIYVIFISRKRKFFLQTIDGWRHRQVKKDLYMMFNGHALVRSLQLFMDVSFSFLPSILMKTHININIRKMFQRLKLHLAKSVNNTMKDRSC